ncbi:MAG: glycosyltransferase [Erysipelotrichaceae bacterium]|nr:glycosyltransferase [Erysipelotrichaceae bacterium]
MNEYDISVIIPVYNAGSFLSECVDSILNQTKDKIEIVIVNDGSTDESASIIEHYAAEYPNIKAITQKNSGVEKARAVGYQNAKGKYIGWIDADDIAKPEMFETLYALALTENADFVYCDYEFFPQKVATKSKWFKEYKGVIDGDFIDRNTQCWNTLVKRELYERVHIDNLLMEFSEYCWISAMIAAEKIAYTNEQLYCYRVGHSSISGGEFIGRVPYYQKGVRITKNLKKLIANTPYEEKLDTYFDYRYIYTLLLLLLVAAKNSDKTAYEETRKELKRMNYLKNPYLDRFVANNYGKLKAWVITRIVPISFLIANPLVRIAM